MLVQTLQNKAQQLRRVPSSAEQGHLWLLYIITLMSLNPSYVPAVLLSCLQASKQNLSQHLAL